MTDLPLFSPLHKRGSQGRKRLREHIFRELQGGRELMDIVDELMSHGHTYDNAYSFCAQQRQKLNYVGINGWRGFEPGPRDGGMYEFAPGHMADAMSMRLIEKARGMR